MELLDYAVTRHQPIDLDARDENTSELLHKEMINKITSAKELYTLMYRELMTTISGDLPKSLYITTNLAKSGMEFWRRIHKNNDPKHIIP